jgi:hypothetical protein
MTASQVVRKRVLLFVGVTMTSTAVTMAFYGMRAVMEVGGSCASGGPYQVAQECPDNVWLLFVSVPLALLGVGLAAAGRLPGGASLTLLAWSGLFLALGWNFLEYGVDPPPPAEGLVWGWLICGVVFVAMGGAPLVYVVSNRRQFFWGDDRPTQFADVSPDQVTAELVAGLSDLAQQLGATPSGPAPTPTAVQPPRPGADLTSSLERLAALHAAGELNDVEYRAAKARLIQGNG